MNHQGRPQAPRRVRWLGCLLVLALAPAPAQARSAIEAKAARMSDEAAELFKSGKFAEAAERFEQAYALDADVIVRLRNAGRAWEEAGRPERAIHCFERYLRKERDAKLRADAEERIAKARALIAERQRAEAAPAAAADKPAADKPDLVAAGGGADAAATVRSAPARDRTLPIAVSAASAAVLGAGVAWIVRVNAADSRIGEATGAGQYDYPGGEAKLADDRATVSTNRGVALGLLGAGLVGAGVSTWLWLRGDSAAPQEAGAVLLPRWTGHDAGLVLSGRF